MARETTTRPTTTIRRARERGHADHGWLDTWHTFSFADYHDEAHMGFATLRVINDDKVAPGRGFGMHPHRDMEILTIILDGALQHEDSMGSSGIIRPGDVQRMTAGTGVFHSEANPSAKDWVHLLQIWIHPETRGLEPGYEQKAFPVEDRRQKLVLVASRDGRAGSLTIHQDASVYVTALARGESVRHELAQGRRAWVHVARGEVTLDGQQLAAGDGAAITGSGSLELSGTAEKPAEVIVFDLV